MDEDNPGQFFDEEIHSICDEKAVEQIQLKPSNFLSLKVISKKRYKERGLQKQLQQEINVLKQLNHPYILKLYEVYESRSSVYLITEYCDGGEVKLLEDQQSYKPNMNYSFQKLNFAQIAYLMKQILEAI